MIIAITIAPLVFGEDAKDIEKKGARESVSLESSPPAVRDTIARETAGAVKGGVVAYSRNGTTVYTVEYYFMNGKHEKLVIAPDGKVIAKEEIEDEME